MSHQANTTNTTSSTSNPTCSTSAANTTNETKPTGVNTTGLNESAAVNTSVANTSAPSTRPTGAHSGVNESSKEAMNEDARNTTAVNTSANTSGTKPTGANTGVNQSASQAINTDAGKNTSCTTNTTCTTNAGNTTCTTTTTTCTTSNTTCPTGASNTGQALNTDAGKNTTCSTSSTKPTGATSSSGPSNTDADYYHLLGVARNASQNQIQHAYKRLASKWHPTRHQQNRADAQHHFNDLTQAFSVLSNAARRDHYDQLTAHKFTKDEALKTFERFFKQNGILEEEQAFFEQHYPKRQQNFYEVLQVKRNASFQDIEGAFRRLGLEYHPKNKAGDKQNEEKFMRLCEAYATLSDALKRRNYDNIEFGELPAHHAHKQFNDVFEQGGLDEEHDKKVLEPLVKKASLKKQASFKQQQPPPLPMTPQQQHLATSSHTEHPHQPHQHPNPEHPHHKHHHNQQPHVHHFSEQITKETYQEKGPDGLHTKSITHKSSVVNGRKVDVTVEEVTKPDGTTQVTETIRDGHQSKVNRFQLKDGQRKALEN